MSTRRKIAHNTAIQMVGKVFSTLLGLYAVIMMTNYLGTEKFGWYVTTITFLQFVAILIDFGLVPVTAQMMSEPRFDKKELFKNLLAYRFVTAVVFLGLTPFVALLFPYPPEVKAAIAISTISFLAVAMNQVLIGFYQTKLKMQVQVVGELLGRIVLVGGLWLLIREEASFLPIMVAVTLSGVAYTIYLWTQAHTESSAGFGFNKEIWRAITHKMWPIAISIMFNVIYLRGDTIILSVFRDQSEVGIYGAAYRVIDILAQTAMMIMGIMLPLLSYHWSRNDKDSFKVEYQRAFNLMMLFALPIVVGVIAVAPQITVLFGEDFIASAAPLRILMLGILGLYLGAIFGHLAVAIDKQKQTIWVYASCAILTFAGYFYFIPQYGMFGAAWMTVFSELYAGLMLFLVVRRYTGMQLNYRTFAMIVFSSLVMGAAVLLFANLHIIFLCLIGAAVYAAFIYGFGVVNKDTIKEIISRKTNAE